MSIPSVVEIIAEAEAHAAMQMGGQQAPVFVVSPRYRRELSMAIEATGRAVELVRRGDHAWQRLAQTTADVVIVDARGALERGLALVCQLAPLVEERRGALLVLLSRGDTGALDEVFRCGATHFLASPFGSIELVQSLRFAERHVRRVRNGGAGQAISAGQATASAAARWHWSRGDSSAAITPALAALLGEPGAGSVDADSILRRMAPGERLQMRRALRRMLASGMGGDIEHRMRIGGIEHRILHHVCVAVDGGGTPTGLSGVVEDLAPMPLAEQAGQHFDPLTGLASQIYARNWLEQALSGSGGNDPECTVVLLAISRFDRINASYGRSVADALLAAVGRRLVRVALTATEPGAILVARPSGAEFLFGLAGPERPEAGAFAQLLAEALDRPFIIEGRVIHLAPRIGIAAAQPGEGAETLLRHASAALADAKSDEPERFRVYTPGRDEVTADRAHLQADLRRAFDKNEIELLYQPQVEIISRRITAVEVLVRWRHPTLGMLSAAAIVDVARAGDLTSRLGEHVLRRSLGEAAGWDASLQNLRLSVNVTAEDLRRPGFDAVVTRALLDANFPADRLTLEVTEGELVDDLEEAALMLTRLRDAGVRIAIDDFGTGYSSLTYVKSLPLDIVKVDRSLVTDIGASARDRVMLHGVVDMARSLGLGVVAEGVETEAQLDQLVRAGCNWYQGFLCAAPMPAAELADFVARWNGSAVT